MKLNHKSMQDCSPMPSLALPTKKPKVLTSIFDDQHWERETHRNITAGKEIWVAERIELYKEF